MGVEEEVVEVKEEVEVGMKEAEEVMEEAEVMEEEEVKGEDDAEVAAAVGGEEAGGEKEAKTKAKRADEDGEEYAASSGSESASESESESEERGRGGDGDGDGEWRVGGERVGGGRGRAAQANELPVGWTVDEVQRAGGGTIDRTYRGPHGEVYRSYVAVMRCITQGNEVEPGRYSTEGSGRFVGGRRTGAFGGGGAPRRRASPPPLVYADGERRSGRARAKVKYAAFYDSGDDEDLGLEEEEEEEEEGGAAGQREGGDEGDWGEGGPSAGEAAPPVRLKKGSGSGRGRPPKGSGSQRASPAAQAPVARKWSAEEENWDEEDGGGGGGASGTGGGGAAHAFEKILARRPLVGLATRPGQFLVKLKGAGYRRARWAPQEELREECPALLNAFVKQSTREGTYAAVAAVPDTEAQEGPAVARAAAGAGFFEPRFLTAERVLAKRDRLVEVVAEDGAIEEALVTEYLVRWEGMRPSEATWEEDFPSLDDPDWAAGDKACLASWAARNKPPGGAPRPAQLSQINPGKFEAKRKGGMELRPYQVEGVRFMRECFSRRRNMILGDEMGLGKTAQTITALETLRLQDGVRGPFLVVAPVSTLGHWKREIAAWSDMVCVELLAPPEDREVLWAHEAYHKGVDGRRLAGEGMLKFHVMLTSYEVVMRHGDELRSRVGAFDYVAVDEAHRLKNRRSKTFEAIQALVRGPSSTRRGFEPRYASLLLLTGTPVQNTASELYPLLNLMDPATWVSEEHFLELFGCIDRPASSSAEELGTAIRTLRDVLKPHLLRRMKEDVTELPAKEETIVWVELTAEQRRWYKALLEDSVGDLVEASKASKVPALRNIAMQLRKVCNHPYMLKGVEDILCGADAKRPGQVTGLNDTPEVAARRKEILLRGSGKMVLLEKLLGTLKAQGSRVLIFSGFKGMLDILSDFLSERRYSHERIDGDVSGGERQKAIDRYTNNASPAAGADGAVDGVDSGAFCFLLSTRAGGVGINLTAADTCIIFDSDWNPQADLQAMARCHRIGQVKDVKVYRFLTKGTYEETLFAASSRKYGLEEAVLGGGDDFAGALQEGKNADVNSGDRIRELLREGAYAILKDGAEGEKEAAFQAFDSESLEDILKGRTETRQIGSRKGNNFSVANFSVDDGKTDKDFWGELLPEAAAKAEAEAKDRGLPSITDVMVDGVRSRRKVNYNEVSVAAAGAGVGDDGDEKNRVKEEWKKYEVERLLGALVTFGSARHAAVRDESKLCVDCGRSEAEVKRASGFLAKVIERCAAMLADSVGQDSKWTPDQCKDLLKEDPQWAGLYRTCPKGALRGPDLLSRMFNTAPRYAEVLELTETLFRTIFEPAVAGLDPDDSDDGGQYEEEVFAAAREAASAAHAKACDAMESTKWNLHGGWWKEEEDRALLLGTFLHGLNSFKTANGPSSFDRIKSDPRLCFAVRFPAEGGGKWKWPKPVMLLSRIKTLVEAHTTASAQGFVPKRRKKEPLSRIVSAVGVADGVEVKSASTILEGRAKRGAKAIAAPLAAAAAAKKPLANKYAPKLAAVQKGGAARGAARAGLARPKPSGQRSMTSFFQGKATRGNGKADAEADDEEDDDHDDDDHDDDGGDEDVDRKGNDASLVAVKNPRDVHVTGGRRAAGAPAGASLPSLGVTTGTPDLVGQRKTKARTGGENTESEDEDHPTTASKSGRRRPLDGYDGDNARAKRARLPTGNGTPPLPLKSVGRTSTAAAPAGGVKQKTIAGMFGRVMAPGRE